MSGDKNTDKIDNDDEEDLIEEFGREEFENEDDEDDEENAEITKT